MAAYKIEHAAGGYLAVTVTFQGQEFLQQLVTEKTGAALDAQLQSYADQYERDWLAMQVESQAPSGDEFA
jgi:hypothetical protein